MLKRVPDYQKQIDFVKLHSPRNSKLILAGIWAEKQMAYELSARLGNHQELLILNDLKVQYGDITAQIDHLILSPYCMYLIETKSCSGTVHVNEFGEWSRNYKPMNSPVEQSKRHEQVLISILNDNLDKFMGKVFGMQKRLGCYQRYHFVAVSEKGQVRGFRKNFPEVMKYDLIAGKILDDYKNKHEPSLLKRITAVHDDEKLRLMNLGELNKFADFLCSINIEEPLEVKFRISMPVENIGKDNAKELFLSCYQGVCTQCSSTNIQVKNAYGYKVTCQDCSFSESFNAKCPACSDPLILKKVKGEFNISCKCGFSAEYIFQAGEEENIKEPKLVSCPKCESPLVERIAKKGANAGNKFLGCSTFPKCRYVETIDS